MHIDQTRSGAHAASYPMVITDSFPKEGGGRNLPGCEADHTPRLRLCGVILPLLCMPSWRVWGLHIDLHLDLYLDGEYYGKFEMAFEEVVTA
jgi:hypothetical protein